MCMAAKDSRSSTLAHGVAPAGPELKLMPQTGERLIARVGSTEWPTAVRSRSASSGSVTVCARPSGLISRSLRAASHVRPVKTSMIRPRTTKPALQYDHIVPGGNTNGSCEQAAT